MTEPRWRLDLNRDATGNLFAELEDGTETFLLTLTAVQARQLREDYPSTAITERDAR